MTKGMPDKSVALLFRRDDARGRGCIEFSWIPTGQRRHVILMPGISQGSDTFSYPFDPTDPRIMQLYVLNNEGKGPLSIENVQYPGGTGTASPIFLAVAEVFESQHVLRLTFHCEDGSTVQNWASLEPVLRHCPQIQTQHSAKGSGTKKSTKA